MLFSYRRLLIILLLLLLTACSTAPSSADLPYQVTPIVVTPDVSGYPYPSNSTEPYPVPTSTTSPFGRSVSVADSLATAQEAVAQSFNPAAKLYGVVPSQIMLRNIGSPPVVSGWFFKFKVEGTVREFYVQVIDGQVSGTTEAEPVVQIQPQELPIDMALVQVTSEQVFARFLEKAPILGLTITDPTSYDLELVHLEGKSHPIWSVVDPTTFTWLYSLDASTGEEVPNPHS